MKDAATLSRREAEIAKLIAWGASKKYISERLFISIRTVENETRTIYKKIGVSKSNELSAWWFCNTYKIPVSDSPLYEHLEKYARCMSVNGQIN